MYFLNFLFKMIFNRELFLIKENKELIKKIENDDSQCMISHVRQFGSNFFQYYLNKLLSHVATYHMHVD